MAAKLSLLKSGRIWDELAQREILMQYRLAYLAYTDVNCAKPSAPYWPTMK